MKLLSDAINQYRKPLQEGRGIKVFRINENFQLTDFMENDGFLNAQIEKLRKEYGKINTVDPESSTYKSLIKQLDKMDQKLLKQVADAKIKFVSSLARNRLKK